MDFLLGCWGIMVVLRRFAREAGLLYPASLSLWRIVIFRQSTFKNHTFKDVSPRFSRALGFFHGSIFERFVPRRPLLPIWGFFHYDMYVESHTREFSLGFLLWCKLQHHTACGFHGNIEFVLGVKIKLLSTICAYTLFVSLATSIREQPKAAPPLRLDSIEL